jgi:2-(1,2-epoxy-1,2-dihydrophenyl)acetyl-CoA isomerase
MKEEKMKLETVLYKIEGNVAVISMNRESAMNSLSRQLFEELTVAFEAAKNDETVRAVVLTGEGRCFCAGGDISELIGLTTEEAVEKFFESANKLMMHLYNFPKPVIAAAHGAIAGAGTSLIFELLLFGTDYLNFAGRFSRKALSPSFPLWWDIANF